MPEKPKLVAEPLPNYEPEVGAALWSVQDARKRTLRLLRDVPPGVLEQENEGNSIGTILYHVALIEADWLYTEILEQPIAEQIANWLPEEDRDQGGILTAIRGQSLEEHLTRLRAIRENFLEMLVGMSREDFHRPRNLPKYEASPAWVLHHLAQHEAEHRSEMGSLILRFTADKPTGASDVAG